MKKEVYCPKCNSTYMLLMPASLTDAVVYLFLGKRMYRCLACKWKGRLRMPPVSAAEPSSQKAA